MAKDLGHKFSLSLSQSYRNVTAVIDSIGAAILSLKVGDTELLDPGSYESSSGFLEGVTMAPWVNRLADGRYQSAGVAYQVPLTDEERSVANHGLVFESDFQVAQGLPGAIKLVNEIDDPNLYPTKLRIEVSYQLTEDGISVTQQITNLGDREAPLSFGSHPYFRIGEFSADQLEIKTSAKSVVAADERLLPIGKVPETTFGLVRDEWVLIGNLEIDNSLTDLHFDENGLSETFLRDPNGRVIRLWQSKTYRHLSLFTPDFYRTAEGKARWSVALEPQTSAANSYNTADDLIVIQPGQVVEGNWGISFAE